jgi:hypothetical protein
MSCDVDLANERIGKAKPMRHGSGNAGTIFIELLTVVSLLCLTGCTPSQYFSREVGPTDVSTILREVKVSGEGKLTTIEILANKPLKYKLYTIVAPPREVIDLPATDPGLVKTIIEINSSIIKRIDISKNATAGQPFTRIIIKLVRHVDFSARTDPTDVNRLLLTIAEHQENPKAK